MLNVVNTIIPLFAIIALGWGLRNRKIFEPSLVGSLNQLVYYLAIPAMIFREVSRTSFQSHFHPTLLLGMLLPVMVVFVLVLLGKNFLSVPRALVGTFLQTSFHGNLGYIGLAVAYYFLGSEGFSRAGILAGFLMLLQNVLGVMALELFSGRQQGNKPFFFLKKIVGNPVLISAMAGILFSVYGIGIPGILDQSLKIISGMALPLALLIIGASLSFDLIKSHLRLVLMTGALKLLGLPALGILMFHGFGLSASQFVPALILLASPTATITYVMAREMDGSPELATAAVSLTTLLSSVTFIFWLSLFPHW